MNIIDKRSTRSDYSNLLIKMNTCAFVFRRVETLSERKGARLKAPLFVVKARYFPALTPAQP